MGGKVRRTREEDDRIAATELAPSGASQRSFAPLAIGGALVGRYEILGVLGAGGMGRVYQARDTELDELVALKVLRRELVDEHGMLDRFRREVKLARRVTHKNVVRTFDIGVHEGSSFLTMEFIDGESLAALVAREGRQTPARVIEIGVAVCAGLDAAHAAGVVHRDLKPDNVLIEKGGRVVVTDFGIARAFDATSSGTRTIGATAGTPAYMAPEQVEGLDDIDVRADIYALGAMLFELLTGERAWAGDAPLGVAAARLVSPPPDPRRSCKEMSAAFATLVMTCMARRREDRFASAELVRHALETQRGEPERRRLIGSGTPMNVIAPRASEANERPVAGLDGTAARTPSRSLASARRGDLVPTLIEANDHITVATFRSALLVHFRGATPPSCVASIRTGLASLPRHEQAVFFAVIEPTSTPPDDVVRGLFTRFFEENRHRLAAAIVTSLGEGFRGAMVRMIVSGIMNLAPSLRLGFPRHVAATLEEAASLAERCAPTLDAKELVQAFRTLAK